MSQLDTKYVTQGVKFITTLLDIAGKLATLSLTTMKSGKITPATYIFDNDASFDLQVDPRAIHIYTSIP